MIKITEVFPNPEGQDGNKEWIELTNFGNTPIDITNYLLDDEEGGSKPYKISNGTILQPNQSNLFRKTQTNLNLNNDGDTVRLFAPTQDPTSTTPLNQIQYGKTTQSLSYSLTTILSQKGTSETWTWTTPTPDQINPTFYHFSGTIAEAPKIEEEFTFAFRPKKSHDQSTQSQPSLTITFTEDTLDFKTAKATLTPGTTIQVLTSKISNSNFQLIDYKIESVTAATNTITTTTYPSPLPALSILILIIILIITLKLKKKFFQV
jgi:hypothetical protein